MFNQKILCLGTNDSSTDQEVTERANTYKTTNHGLITDPYFIPTKIGYYHTTTVDLPAGTAIELGKRFDKVILLDQPVAQWSHWKMLLSSYKIMQELSKIGVSADCKYNKNIQHISYFDNLVQTNKTFCIYPWVLLQQEDGKVTTCTKSSSAITKIDLIKDWKTDENYTVIRNQMLAGESVKGCQQCYYEERQGIVSTRQFETLDWISKLELKNIQDVTNITRPMYYEIRLGNLCNMACRMCIPEYSSIIDKEFKELNIRPSFFGITDVDKLARKDSYSNTKHIDIQSLDKYSRVYFTGGEPTVHDEFYEFMQRCIDAGKTDFDFCLGFNGKRLTEKMVDMFSHFSNMNFSFSIDGYGPVNDYIRSYSKWETIIKNANILKAQGHSISLETIPSIYNANNLHLLFEFFDSEFPDSVQFLQLEQQHPGQYLSAFAHPDAESCVESLEKVKKTQKYLTDGRGGRSIIDSMYKYYSKNPIVDTKKLKLFYDFNDKLDKKRGTSLKDILPELDQGRSLLTK
ncbi:twitch domain-containing radical SAM protein [Methylophilaceae bacterium]|nr:twitch domain-containing radical SAM protein [Methylophilaceae bacterium]